uniref:Uncharacterized protein n=1 Tax=viral metagenome TaxID=1070528 RepID=A0A6C0H7C6_9ZZZZ
MRITVTIIRNGHYLFYLFYFLFPFFCKKMEIN